MKKLLGGIIHFVLRIIQIIGMFLMAGYFILCLVLGIPLWILLGINTLDHFVDVIEIVDEKWIDIVGKILDKLD